MRFSISAFVTSLAASCLVQQAAAAPVNAIDSVNIETCKSSELQDLRYCTDFDTQRPPMRTSTTLNPIRVMRT